MTTLATAFVEIRPDTSRMRGELDTAAKDGGKRFTDSFKGALKIGSVIAGAFAVTKGIDFLKGSIEEAREAQKVGAQTAAVLKSTGQQAGITSKQIGDLAGAISSKVGIDDEAIQSGENLLLTFTNLRNETGKGNDIFNQATQIMTDMSVAMGQDMKSSAIQVGKALNDPIKGITALSRVGVSFTEIQKAQIKALVDGGNANALMAVGLIQTTTEYNNVLKANQGDTAKTIDQLTNGLNPAQMKTFNHYVEGGHAMEAQKRILKELNKEFKGSAEAQVTPAEKAAVAWGNFKETIGTAVLPVIDTLLTFFTDKLMPGVMNAADLIHDKVIPKITDFADKVRDKVIGPLSDIGGRISDAFKGISIAGVAQDLADQAKGWAGPVIDGFKNGLDTGDWSGLGSAIGTGLIRTIAGLTELAGKIGGILGDLMAKVDWVGIGIAMGKQAPSLLVGVAAGLLNFDLMGLLKGLASHWQEVLLAVLAIAFTPGRVIGKLGEILARIPFVGKLLEWLLLKSKTLADGIWKFVWDRLLKPLGEGFITGFRKIFPTIGSKFADWLKLFPTRLGLARIAVIDKATEMMQGLASAIGKAFHFVGEMIGRVIGWILKPWAKAGSWLLDAGTGIMRGLLDGLKSMVSAITGWLGRFLGESGPIRGAFSKAVDGISKIWNKLKDAARKPIEFIVNTVYNNGIRKVVNAIPGIPDLPSVHFADGGMMPGYTPGRDVHHFYSPTAGHLGLSGGEPIMRPEFGKVVGRGWVDDMNAAARNGGTAGVAKALAKRGVYHFAGGGIFRPTASGSYGAVHDQWTGFPAVDVRVGTGTPVHAVAPGQVTVSQDLATSYGHWIKLAHAGFQSLYAHLERRLVGAGARVSGGQLIGYSDSTGNSTGPHLHFGVSGKSPLTFMSASTNYGSAGSADTGGGGGGFLGGLWDKAKNLVSGLGDKLGGWVSHLGDMGGWGPMLGGTVKSVVGDVIDWAKDKISSAISEGSGASSTPGAAGPKNYAMSILGNYGWGSDQFTPLDHLWTRESGWNYKATNPSSGAYGIPQALPPGKMASAGADWRTNPATQIRWGLGYIKGRYGNPAGAWAHSESTGWYDKGGLANGPGMMPKATLRPERVLSPQQTEAFERLVDKLDRGALNGNAPLVGQMVVRDERAAEAALMRTMAKANVMAALP